MKLTINQTIEKEVDIKIPSYFRVSCHFFKVFSDTRIISVCEATGHESIQEQHLGLIFNLDADPVEISEKAFTKKFNSVLRNIKSK